MLLFGGEPPLLVLVKQPLGFSEQLRGHGRDTCDVAEPREEGPPAPRAGRVPEGRHVVGGPAEDDRAGVPRHLPAVGHAELVLLDGQEELVVLVHVHLLDDLQLAHLDEHRPVHLLQRVLRSQRAEPVGEPLGVLDGEQRPERARLACALLAYRDERAVHLAARPEGAGDETDQELAPVGAM